MKWFSSNRKTESSEKQQTSENNQKEAQKRELFRIVYPPNSAPKILNKDFEIIDLSAQAIKFTSYNKQDYDQLSKERHVELKLKFADSEILDVQGEIINIYDTKDASSRKYFVCLFDQKIAASRISKEQSYLLKNFPEFCRRQS